MECAGGKNIMVLLFKVIAYITVEAKINNSVEFIVKLHQSNINVGITLSVRLSPVDYHCT